MVNLLYYKTSRFLIVTTKLINIKKNRYNIAIFGVSTTLDTYNMIIEVELATK